MSDIKIGDWFLSPYGGCCTVTRIVGDRVQFSYSETIEIGGNDGFIWGLPWFMPEQSKSFETTKRRATILIEADKRRRQNLRDQ